MKVSESCRIALMASEEYQYATMSAYSPTMSELPLQGKLEILTSPTHDTDDN
jgi:hypothetical protein